MMLHNLTIGHLDPAAIVSEHRIAVLRPLEIDVVDRLLKELGGIDKDGSPTLERGKVEFRDGYLVCPWRIGGWHNRTAEESRSASSRRRDASWPTASIRGSSSRSSSRG